MRILCYAIDLPGHLDWGGYLPTAIELQRRGHQVLWVSGPGVKTNIQAANLPFVALPNPGWRHGNPPLPKNLSPKQKEIERQRRALTVWLYPPLVLAALQKLQHIARDFQPDVVISEPFAVAATLLAERHTWPLVIIGRPAQGPLSPNPKRLPNPTLPHVQRLLKQAQLPGHYWDLERGQPRSPHLHIDFFSREWYADLPDIAPQTLFCGGRPAAMPQQHPATNPPQILVTLGSTFTNDEAFFRIAAESALLAAARAHIVTGKRTPHILNALHQAPPGPATISQWIDYTQEFPHLSGIVHHGGMATTHSALIHGIPQIVIPHAGDQFPQAARVTQARVGYGIKAQDFTMQNAPILLTDILWAPDFAEKARTMARHLHTLGGIPRAAQAIETLGNIS